MSDGQELDAKGTDLHCLVVGDFDQLGAAHHMAFVAAVPDQSKRER